MSGEMRVRIYAIPQFLVLDSIAKTFVCTIFGINYYNSLLRSAGGSWCSVHYFYIYSRF